MGKKAMMRTYVLKDWPGRTMRSIAEVFIKPKVRKRKFWVIEEVEGWGVADMKDWIRRRRKQAEVGDDLDWIGFKGLRDLGIILKMDSKLRS